MLKKKLFGFKFGKEIICIKSARDLEKMVHGGNRMNVTNLTGRLVKDPELKTTNNGKSVCKFTLAVNRYNITTKQNEADFINCVVWGKKTAENLSKYMSKGGLIGVEGSIKTGSYTDNNGTKKYTTDIWVEKIEYLSKVGESTSDNATSYQASNSYQKTQTKEHFKQQEGNPFDNLKNEFEISNDDLPF